MRDAWTGLIVRDGSSRKSLLFEIIKLESMIIDLDREYTC